MKGSGYNRGGPETTLMTSDIYLLVQGLVLK